MKEPAHSYLLERREREKVRDGAIEGKENYRESGGERWGRVGGDISTSLVK